MNRAIFQFRLIRHCFRRLFRQRLLSAGFALLCLLLPLAAGPAAEAALSEGVGFSGITLAIAAPEGDPIAGRLEQVLSGMEDISRYCRVRAMERADALDALEQGAVTAVLALPERFLGGILEGTNPDVELIVSGERPLEALLTLWVGQSASDLLTAVQSGIYTVLELAPGEENMLRINLRYISWTLDRQSLYTIRQIPVTEQLPIGLHYSLSLFACLSLALTPMFAGLYEPRWLGPQRRYRALGIGWGRFYGASLAVCCLTQAALTAVFQLAVSGSDPAGAILSGLLCGLFCGAFGSLCCLLTGDTGSCGVVSFLGSLAFLALSGGILPPVLMPAFLRPWIRFSPVTWLRGVLAAPLGHGLQPFPAAALALTSLAMILAGGLLYARRGEREVTGP